MRVNSSQGLSIQMTLWDMCRGAGRRPTRHGPRRLVHRLPPDPQGRRTRVSDVGPVAFLDILERRKRRPAASNDSTLDSLPAWLIPETANVAIVSSLAMTKSTRVFRPSRNAVRRVDGKAATSSVPLSAGGCSLASCVDANLGFTGALAGSLLQAVLDPALRGRARPLRPGR
jgi:hypothetical protein